MGEFQFIERIRGEPYYAAEDLSSEPIPVVNVFEKYFIEEKSPREISNEIEDLRKIDVHRIESFLTTGGFEETQRLYEEFEEFNTEFEEKGPEGFINEETVEEENILDDQKGLDEVYEFFRDLVGYEHVERSSINRRDSRSWLDLDYADKSGRIEVREDGEGYEISSNIGGEFLTELRVEEHKLEEKVREVYNSAFYALTD
ncbi:MAG: hypothetical protein H8Z69_02455 [Nanohaloarchaea archaeon]|nr:hypothetical protein [Candidatus Nanohaloarchaea archaeon]